MMKLAIALVLSGVLVSVPLLAQEHKGMPMKGGGMMDKMMEMHGQMGEMQKGMGGMMKGKGMMKGDDMKEMEKMMDEGHMSPGEMENMSKMMGEMCAVMEQRCPMAEPGKTGEGQDK